jgi:hypothetical protein
MKYFVPNLKLSSDLPPQNRLENKLGGIPWGLKPEQLPVCNYCGKTQSLLAQFTHDLERLNLGASKRVLFVFQCNNLDSGACPTWEGGAGANACFILDENELENCLTPMPKEASPSILEVRVTDWMAYEDGISVDEIPAFYDDVQLYKLPEKQLESVPEITKLGSVPTWIQSSEEAPGEGWDFVGQLCDSYTFFEKPSDVRWKAHIWESNICGERKWILDGPNFGDAGIGYIFVRYQAEKPEGWFFWQCS